MHVHRIVVGIDFSEPSLAAARWAARDLAGHAELALVHVIPLAETRGALRRTLPAPEHFLADVRAATLQGLRGLANSLGAVRCTTTVRIGEPAEELAEAAAEHEADLIVAGRTGQRVRGAKRLGTTADRLTRHARLPVLLAAGRLDAPPRSMLAPVDESATGMDVLRWASRLRAQCDASLTALHVVHDTVRAYLAATASALPAGLYDACATGELRDEAHAWLRGRLRMAGIDPALATCAVVIGDAKHEVLVAAGCFDSDLVVIGRHGADATDRSGIGGVTRAVLRPTSRSVLVIPPAVSAARLHGVERRRHRRAVAPASARPRRTLEVWSNSGPPAA